MITSENTSDLACPCKMLHSGKQSGSWRSNIRTGTLRRAIGQPRQPCKPHASNQSSFGSGCAGPGGQSHLPRPAGQTVAVGSEDHPVGHTHTIQEAMSCPVFSCPAHPTREARPVRNGHLQDTCWRSAALGAQAWTESRWT
jgi:hypothetical protein